MFCEQCLNTMVFTPVIPLHLASVRVSVGRPQVRCMVAVLFMIGRGDEAEDTCARMLDVERTPRKPVYQVRCSNAGDDNQHQPLWNMRISRHSMYVRPIRSNNTF